MTAITHPQLDQRPADWPSGETRLQRRALLDLSIDEELVRGDRRGADLAPRLRLLLALIVAAELDAAEPLGERALREARRARRPFGTARLRTDVEALCVMNLARREGRSVRATVAGVAAIERPSLLGRPHPPRALLRLLRRAELDGVRGAGTRRPA
ncbi:hypothetical protein [Microbacterium hydrocarbonoxydans]|uniref:hypothetical protein n=1 Tax=Microbacterium hydrocarbonoxydans TaxID=273678 RepID=UPI00203B0D31|nr:hypothetical protein [Microbacterium hydrocarbonoxydans]MCM3779669.1 hypothetical protein [Microbacterium hydrocarbonoxydans]